MNGLCSRTWIARLLPFAAAAVVVAAPGRLDAQDDSADSRAPAIITRGDLRRLAIGAGLAMLAYQTDPSVRREVRSAGWQRSDALGVLADIGNGWGDPTVVVLGLALWGGGAYRRDRTMAIVGLRAVEAITWSSVATKVLKGTIGRGRPRVSPTDAWNVELGRGFRDGDYEAMPSGHATAAFAFAAAVTSEVARVAPARARVVGVTTFGLATLTAYARMYRDAHWLSDVTMGATIGTVGGWAVHRWHATRPGNRLDAVLLPMLATAPDGRPAFGVTIPWR